ncbi:hypothetical protein Tco_1239739 [Tanacetum coccineum]
MGQHGQRRAIRECYESTFPEVAIYAYLHAGREKYPLTPTTITDMLNKKLQVDYFSEMAYQLLKLFTKQLKN